jgi:hypothetical protein
MRAAPQVAVQLRGVFEAADDDQLLGGKSPSARTRSTFALLQPSARATEVVADTAWLVYRKWGKVPWLFARFATRNPLRRLRICTDRFRRFPSMRPVI